MHRMEREFAGRTLILETGRMAKLAQGSCLVQFGETVVLCSATVQNKPTHLPFFPLTVEYREKSYAAGKIPGGFFKREGRPGEKEILAAPPDRSSAPSALPGSGFMHETQVACFVLSRRSGRTTRTCSAVIGASVALNACRRSRSTPRLRRSGWAGSRVTWILNPTFQQLEYSDLDITVAGSESDAITMVEGGALEVPEADILEGLQIAHDGHQGARSSSRRSSWKDISGAGHGVGRRSSPDEANFRAEGRGPGRRSQVWPRRISLSRQAGAPARRWRPMKEDGGGPARSTEDDG